MQPITSRMPRTNRAELPSGSAYACPHDEAFTRKFLGSLGAGAAKVVAGYGGQHCLEAGDNYFVIYSTYSLVLLFDYR